MNNLTKVFFGLFFLPTYAAAKDVGTFFLVKGVVYIENPDNSRTAAKVNSKVFEGQTVVCESDSRAKLVMSDRNIINILPNTKVKIEKYRTAPQEKGVSLRLIEGRIRTNVEQSYDNKKSKFEVRTATAVAGVRGTQFVTSFDKATQNTEIVTINGRVSLMAVARQGMPNSLPVEIFVNRGEQVQISKSGQASEPVKIPKQEFKNIESESSVINEEKRKRLDQTKLEDSESGGGGVNGSPLTPQDNLLTNPRTLILRDNRGKSRTIIEIRN